MKWIGHFPCPVIPRSSVDNGRLEYRLLPDDALSLPDPEASNISATHIELLDSTHSHCKLMTDQHVDAQ